MSSRKLQKHFYLERDVIELLEALSEENHIPMSAIVNRALYFTYYADKVRDVSYALYLRDPAGYGIPYDHPELIYEKVYGEDLYGKLDIYFGTALFGCGFFPDTVEEVEE